MSFMHEYKFHANTNLKTVRTNVNDFTLLQLFRHTYLAQYKIVNLETL